MLRNAYHNWFFDVFSDITYFFCSFSVRQKEKHAIDFDLEQVQLFDLLTKRIKYMNPVYSKTETRVILLKVRELFPKIIQEMGLMDS